MTTRRLTPIDAQAFWLAAKIPNDTFLLFGFAGVPADPAQVLDDVAARARRCPDLTVRIDDHRPWDYPALVRREVGPSKAERIVVWRKKNGGFKRVADLRRVKGFGYKTFKRLEPFLDVTGETTLAPRR